MLNRLWRAALVAAIVYIVLVVPVFLLAQATAVPRRGWMDVGGWMSLYGFVFLLTLGLVALDDRMRRQGR